MQFESATIASQRVELDGSYCRRARVALAIQLSFVSVRNVTNETANFSHQTKHFIAPLPSNI
jgi:hypothetical protein